LFATGGFFCYIRNEMNLYCCTFVYCVKYFAMRQYFICLISFLFMGISGVIAQCSICTKTASQLGKESGEGLNSGILYLMLLPFAIGGYIAWRWWKNEKSSEA
jgi:hypothetical protein